MKQCTVTSLYESEFSLQIVRPLFSWRVPMGFPSPAENYIEGRIDLNERLIKHRLATFYIEVTGDSMYPLITEGELLVVDRMEEFRNRDIVVARIGDELCVKRLRVFPDQRVYLMSENEIYQPIELSPDMDYEIWGVVMHSVKSFRKPESPQKKQLKKTKR